MSTIPDIYIIESLDPDDEGNGRFEGRSLREFFLYMEKTVSTNTSERGRSSSPLLSALASQNIGTCIFLATRTRRVCAQQTKKKSTSTS